MKHQLYLAFIAIGLLLLTSCGNKQANLPMNNDIDSLSYAIGIDLGNQLTSGSQEFNLNMIAQAINDTKSGKPKMTQQEAVTFMQEYQQRDFLKNKAAGEQFLQENKSKEGVVTLPSGLQYKVTKQGTGVKPKASDVVEVHYRGTLIDGREFDSSYSHGETISFPLTGVIKGWTEGLQQVNEGSTVTLYIPQDLAYGANPMPGSIIEPFMTLIFDIELIKVTPSN